MKVIAKVAAAAALLALVLATPTGMDTDILVHKEGRNLDLIHMAGALLLQVSEDLVEGNSCDIGDFTGTYYGRC